MSMNTVLQQIVLCGSCLAAVIAICTAVYRFCGWISSKKQQEEKLKKLEEKNAEEHKQMKAEDALIIYALRACLDGLQQLGANHTVPVAKDKLDKYINQQAHK